MKKKILSLLTVFIFTIALLTPAVSAAGLSINDVRHGVAVIECGPANASTGVYDWPNQVWRGSCFFVGIHGQDPQYLVTNYHVIESFVDNGRGELMTDTFTAGGLTYEYTFRMKIRVYYSANDFEEAYLVEFDSVKDIALLKLANPTKKRAALHLEPPVDSMSFSDVWVVGFPSNAENVIAGSTSTYSETDAVGKKGVISKIFIQQSTGTTEIQTDCEINGGNSGGPMVNSDGKVVGIATYSVYTAEALTEEIGVIKEQKYAIGSDMVIPILERNGVKYSTGDYGSGSSDDPETTAPVNVSVNFDANGGTVAQASSQVEAGAAYGSLPTPTNGIMEFDGWYTDPAAGDRVTVNSNAPSGGSITLFAHWKVPVWVWIAAVVLAVVILAVVIIAVVSSGRKKTPGPVTPPPPTPVQHTVNDPISQTKPAQPQRRAVIRSAAPQHKGQSITVGDRPVSIGRSAKDCAVVYNSDTAGVSSVHCSISYDSARNEFTVTDVSTYGTFLMNGQKLPKGMPTNVKPGTSLYLGDKGNVITLTVE